MQELWNQVTTMLWNIAHRPRVSDVLDILIVAVLIYQVLRMTRETRVSQVLKGVGVLLLGLLLSEIFALRTINWILRWLVNAGAVVLVVLFQPEIRRVLEGIGGASLLERVRGGSDTGGGQTIDELVQALVNLSKRRVGALVVIEQHTRLKEVCDTGTLVDARVSQPLIENIFEPNTPLHDGAVILHGDRVVAAACVLRLSEGSGISRELGTRHRAALGVSETTDAVVLIVSEETGIISVARGGKLTRHMDTRSLTLLLRDVYAAPRRGGGILRPAKRGEAHESDGQ
ncbi:MAG: diadenylate cyclase CdaA [Oscillospiraceae bacterium]|nr:diadenylate cyclase CdaA [Oscillospiraceae bacterium]